MRIISKSRLIEFWERHRQAEAPLREWHAIVSVANWRHFEDLRAVYPSADQVMVKSRRTTTVFNVGGNKYRLITAVHYNAQTIYILDVLTHAEYGTNRWKEKF